MNYLLDTHIWIWASLEPERLSPAARNAVVDPASRLHICSLSWWEMLLAHRKGRLRLEMEPIAWGRASLQRMDASVLQVTEAIAIEAERLDGFERQDPGDRFIVATARIHQLTLITADEWILRWPGVATFW